MKEELYVITLNRNAKFEEEPTWRCNNEMRNFAYFRVSTGRPQNLHFHGVLMWNVYKVLAKKITVGLCVITLNSDAKFQKQSTCCCKNDMRNLENVHVSTGIFQNLLFDGVLMSEAYQDWVKKLERSYVSRHWSVTQNCKKNQHVVVKITWGIWRIFTLALKSFKICTLIGYLCPKHIKNELKN